MSNSSLLLFYTYQREDYTPYTQSKLVLQTKLTLNELAKKTRRITIVWIKAHVGHEGNELADELAKEGTKKKLQTCNIGIPHNNICLLYTSPSPRD